MAQAPIINNTSMGERLFAFLFAMAGTEALGNQYVTFANGDAVLQSKTVPTYQQLINSGFIADSPPALTPDIKDCAIGNSVIKETFSKRFNDVDRQVIGAIVKPERNQPLYTLVVASIKGAIGAFLDAATDEYIRQFNLSFEDEAALSAARSISLFIQSSILQNKFFSIKALLLELADEASSRSDMPKIKGWIITRSSVKSGGSSFAPIKGTFNRFEQSTKFASSDSSFAFVVILALEMLIALYDVDFYGFYANSVCSVSEPVRMAAILAAGWYGMIHGFQKTTIQGIPPWAIYNSPYSNLDISLVSNIYNEKYRPRK